MNNIKKKIKINKPMIFPDARNVLAHKQFSRERDSESFLPV
jgi:hypothetical protein